MCDWPQISLAAICCMHNWWLLHIHLAPHCDQLASHRSDRTAAKRTKSWSHTRLAASCHASHHWLQVAFAAGSLPAHKIC